MIAPFLDTLRSYDIATFAWCMRRKRAAQIAHIARRISWLGNGPLYALLGLAALGLDGERGQSFLLTGLMAFAIELPGYLVLKNGIRCPRPQDTFSEFTAYIVPSDTFSFPSGHTAAAFLMATLSLQFYPTLAPMAFTLAAQYRLPAWVMKYWRFRSTAG